MNNNSEFRTPNSKLKMRTANKADENFKKLAEMFPNAVTEAPDENGVVVRAIDKDVLMQEINTYVVEGREERYQFTWPDKKKSVLLANAPSSKTLRPVRVDEITPTGSDSSGNPYCSTGSVGKDGTVGGWDSENLYIEGDNLEVLKLLQETYLGKIKMIYIDPPYNTGNDFVYEDDFSMDNSQFIMHNGGYDENGNRLFKNMDTNGRFHTDWLNMIYPRLRLAKDMLADNGVIFMSIDDNEADNLIKIGCEIFGSQNYIASFPWRKRTAKSDVPFGISQDYEQIVCFAKSNMFSASIEGKERKYYTSKDFPDRPWRIHDLTKQTTASERPNSYFTIVNPKTGDEYPANPNATWRITKDSYDDYYKQDRIIFPGDYTFLNISKPVLRYWKEDDVKKAGDSFGKVAVSTKLPDNIGMSQDGTKEITALLESKAFSFPKPTSLIQFLLRISTEKDSYVLDFFSGSATTAHAVMQLNAEDGGHRKFIMVQLPEETDEKSEAYKAGYKNICEIGKERIRRAGVKIRNGEFGMRNDNKGDNSEFRTLNSELDTGFRVLKLDSTNMKDVFYNPDEFDPSLFEKCVDNIKEDRTPEDLLFQVMLELGAFPSSKIETLEICGHKVFRVSDDYLYACFDKNITDEVVKAIANEHPYYAVFRDSGMKDDSVLTNFDQIFATYSPTTIRKVL